VARLSDRLPENAPGAFYVDDSCIDCGTCREVAPAVFTSEGSRTDQSYVHRQPEREAETLRAAMALVACPTSSIGTTDRSVDVRAAGAAFPERVDGNVYFCGYAAESSFGARSWLVVRPEGNVLVDSPRFARPLVERLEALGGVDLMFLTHRDDVADHAKFAKRFGCRRILHEADRASGTRDVEWLLEGDAPIEVAPDLLAIPVPGHTRGSTVLLHRSRHLFTGDHLWQTERTGRLHASRSVCWHSWAKQRRSMERLLEHSFTWVLPGHGQRHRTASVEEMRAELRALIGEM
jgi:glyoxylase-like metal-dependent hydrolase (beta-lactamase superfamily II)/ferredoxin